MIGDWFLIIGARKSGTTWIYKTLEDHPQINMAKDRKEVHFFDRYYSRGLDWYKSNFVFEGDKLVGEATPDYLHDGKCSQRIKETMPNVKMICVLRNPINRAYSDYKYVVQNENYQKNFREALKEKNHILKEGLYYQQLKKYYDIFPKEQIKVLFFEEIINDKKSMLDEVYDFLDIKKHYPKEIINKKANSSKIPRFKFLFSFGKKIVRKLYDYDLVFVINFLKKIGLKRIFFDKNGSEFPEMSLDSKEYLSNYYKKDIFKLGKLLNKDLTKIWDLYY